MASFLGDLTQRLVLKGTLGRLNFQTSHTNVPQLPSNFLFFFLKKISFTSSPLTARKNFCYHFGRPICMLKHPPQISSVPSFRIQSHHFRQHADQVFSAELDFNGPFHLFSTPSAVLSSKLPPSNRDRTQDRFHPPALHVDVHARDESL